MDDALGPGRRQGRRLWPRALPVVLGVALVASVAVAATGFGGSRPTPPPAASVTGTAQVTRATLRQTESISGTLGYGPVSTVTARASATPPPAPPTDPAAAAAPPLDTGPGSITWLPDVGSIVHPGQAAYRVDDQPVVLLTGTMPMYRVVGPGAVGADVAEVEANLAAFGFGGFTVDDHFTASTATAVQHWQRQLGRPQTGTIDVDEVVVTSGPIRIVEHLASLGGEAIDEVVAYTGTTPVVTVALPVVDQHLVSPGMTADLILPDGRTIAGTVFAVGSVASTTAQTPPGGPAATPANATVETIVAIPDAAALGNLDGAPVQLTLVVRERRDVLTVPVAALVALREGGYGVEVVDGATSKFVAVEAGMFGDGLVEVTGAGISEGVTVAVPG